MQPLGSGMRGVGPMRLRWIAAIGVLALATSACGARFEGHEETVVAGGETPATSASEPPAESTADTTGTETTEPAGPVEAGRTTGITDDEIKIGYLLPLSGAAPVPSRFDVGVNVYWNVVNEQGGIDGRKVTVVDRGHPVAGRGGQGQGEEAHRGRRGLRRRGARSPREPGGHRRVPQLPQGPQHRDPDAGQPGAGPDVVVRRDHRPRGPGQARRPVLRERARRRRTPRSSTRTRPPSTRA